MAFGQPRRALIWLRARGCIISFLGDKHVEGKLRQRARRYQQQVLVFDQVGNLAKQRQIELVRAGSIERQGSARRRNHMAWFLQQLSAPVGALAVPRGTVQTATERRHLARQRRGAPSAAHPGDVGFRHDPDERFLGSGLCLWRVEEQHERLVGVQLTLNLLDGKRLRLGKRRIVRKRLPQRCVDLGETCIDRGKARAESRFGRGAAGCSARAATRIRSLDRHSATRSWRSRTRWASSPPPLACRAAIWASDRAASELCAH